MQFAFKKFGVSYMIQEVTIIEDDTPKEFSIWNSFDLNISYLKPRRTAASSRAINEVHDDVISRNKDPLNW